MWSRIRDGCGHAAISKRVRSPESLQLIISVLKFYTKAINVLVTFAYVAMATSAVKKYITSCQLLKELQQRFLPADTRERWVILRAKIKAFINEISRA
jgi:hypothetical protein